jgi:hypothetical protein
MEENLEPTNVLAWLGESRLALDDKESELGNPTHAMPCHAIAAWPEY